MNDLLLFMEQAEISPHQMETLVRLAATSACQFDQRPAGAYEDALWSFSDWEEIHDLALKVGKTLDEKGA